MTIRLPSYVKTILLRAPIYVVRYTPEPENKTQTYVRPEISLILLTKPSKEFCVKDVRVLTALPTSVFILEMVRNQECQVCKKRLPG